MQEVKSSTETPDVDASETLASKIKELESKCELQLPIDRPWVARLDGHGFSKFTKGFQKPCDPRITLAMIETTGDLIKEFNARLGYTQSDEITLVFPAVDTDAKQSALFSGRTQKLSSIFAGFATARFNVHLNAAKFSDEEKLLREKVSAGKGYFDCRVFTAPTAEAAMLAVYWRHKFDCYRNGVSTLAQCHFSHKQLEHVKTQDKIKMLESKEIKLSAYPTCLFFGTFVKRELHTVQSQDPRTNTHIEVARTRIRTGSFEWKGTTDERVEFVFSKYWM